MRFFLLLCLALVSFASFSNEVQLMKAVSGVGTYQGVFQDIGMTFLVKHFEGERRLVVHAKNVKTNEWTEFQAHFDQRLNEDEELWSLQTSIRQAPSDFEFFIVYEAQRGRFTDDNQGRLYSLKANEGVYLNEGLNVSLFSASFQASGVNASSVYMSFQIAVRNIAYAKNVKIYYTRDSWRRSSVLEAQYQPEWNFTRGTILSPNSYGIEMWAFTGYSKEVFYPGEEICYFISYTVDGKEYVDNNFGRDYSFILPTLH